MKKKSWVNVMVFSVVTLKRMIKKRGKIFTVLLTTIWIVLGVMCSFFTLSEDVKENYLKDAQIIGIFDRNIETISNTITVADKFWGEITTTNCKLYALKGLVFWKSSDFLLKGKVNIVTALKVKESSTQQILEDKSFDIPISRLQKLIQDNNITNPTLVKGVFTGKLRRQKTTRNLYPLLPLSSVYLAMALVLILSLKMDSPHFLGRLFLFFSAGMATDFSIMKNLVDLPANIQSSAWFFLGPFICWLILAAIFLCSDKFVKWAKLSPAGPASIKLSDGLLKGFSVFGVIALLFGIAFIILRVDGDFKAQRSLIEELGQAKFLILVNLLVPPVLFRGVGYVQFFGIFFWLAILPCAFINRRFSSRDKKFLKFQKLEVETLLPVLTHWGRLFTLLLFGILPIWLGLGLLTHGEVTEEAFYAYCKGFFYFFLLLLITFSVLYGYFAFKKMAERGLFTIDLFKPFVLGEIRGLIVALAWLFLFIVSLCAIMLWIIPRLFFSGIAVPGLPYESLGNIAPLVYKLLPLVAPSVLAFLVFILVLSTWLFAIPYLRLFGVKSVTLSLIAFASTWGVQELTTRLSPFFPRRIGTYIIISFFVATLTYIFERRKDYLLRRYRDQTVRCSNSACNRLISRNFPYCPFCGAKAIRSGSVPMSTVER